MVPLQQHDSFAATLTLLGRAPVRLGPHLMLSRRFAGGLRVNLLSRVDLGEASLPCVLGEHRAPLIVSPEHAAPGLARIGAVPVMTPATLAELPLTDADRMRAAMHQKWRNRLKQAETLPLRLSVQTMKTDPGHWLLQAEAAQRRANRYSGWPPALTLAFAAANPGAARVFTAHRGTETIAAMLFLRHGEAATYHIGHTTDPGRAASAHTWLLWQAMLWHAQRGCTLLDLGLIDTLRNPGLARFKLGSGALPRRLGGTWAWWPRLGRLLSPFARLDRKAFPEGGSPASFCSQILK